MPRVHPVPRCPAPGGDGGPEIEAFLGWLANERKVSASTHKQALSALLFLYSKLLEVQLPWMSEIGRPRVRRRLPVVLSHAEVAAVFRGLDGEQRLFAQLLYGTGKRRSEGNYASSILTWSIAR